MKIRLISDVILDPLVKELKGKHTGLEINNIYEEDLIAFLLTDNGDIIDSEEVLFIHSDQFFHRKAIEWQQSYLSAVALFSEKVRNKIIISNSLSFSFDSKALTKSTGIFGDIANEYNQSWTTILQRPSNYVFDFNYLINQVGSLNSYQYALGHLYQMPYTKVFIKLFAETFSEQINWLSSEEKKAIILDCDNTLWKGVIGEDTIEGIKCDKNAEGILFYHFQLFLKSKKQEGFLLCLCSKNNIDDVKEAFDSKGMPLTWDDFVEKKVNWNDKWSNIKQIALDLNIGVNSFIYIDDNPFEINSVSELIKGIATFEFKADYASFLKLTNSFLFKRKQILQDDIEKSTQYLIEQQRKEVQSQYQSIDDFIKSLNINLDVRLNDINDLDRLAQMTGKTNQFNFNKQPYSIDELQKFINDGNHIYSLKVSDKFGNYGTVGMMLIEIVGDKAIVENYLMSCRALGKRIEVSFYEHVMNILAKENLGLEGFKFVKTEKNKPAQEFILGIDKKVIKVTSHAS